MKVGIIGCGTIAKNAHLPAYRNLKVEVVGVADSNEAAAKAFAHRNKIGKWFTDYADLLREDIDIVSICTPPSTHAKITIDAAGMGKHVLVEKPMAIDLAEAGKMIDACKKSKVKLCIAHNYRFFPCVLDAKQRLVDGRIGKLISMHLCMYDYIDAGAMRTPWRFNKWGVLEDIGPHAIDIINFLCESSLEDVQVVARDFTGNMDFLNHVEALLLFKNKASVNLDLSWLSGSCELSLKALGTGGLFDMDIRNNYLREMHGFTTPLEELNDVMKKLFQTARSVANRTYFKGPLLYHQVIIEKFIESILHGTSPPVTGEDGRDVMRIMDSIKSAIEK
jgi:predicted dehydrogenase